MGLDVTAYDSVPGGPWGALLPQLYPQNACKADVIASGHVNLAASNLSAYGTTVYTDYDFAIDRLLKKQSRVACQIRSRHSGDQARWLCHSAGGPREFQLAGTPATPAGIDVPAVSCLHPRQFLLPCRRFILNLNSGREQLDDCPSGFFCHDPPRFGRRTLEAAIGSWLTSCGK
jgi:hypothetical protein